MSTAPCLDTGICLRLRGNFQFKANVLGENEIEDSYMLEILVPNDFPHWIPEVKETDGRIPHKSSFHVFKDGTLCLGSQIRLLQEIYNAPTLSGFAEKCLVPYLYAVSRGSFEFGELDHNIQGVLLDDYSDLFGLETRPQTIKALQLLKLEKRIANKKPCPCGCGKRLLACRPFHSKLTEFRKIIKYRLWFNKHVNELVDELNNLNQTSSENLKSRGQLPDK